MTPMTASEHRTFLGLCRKDLGIRQGLKPQHGGGRVRQFCAWLKAHGQPKGYSTVLAELDPNGAPKGRGTAKAGVALAVAICRFAGTTRPIDYLARCVRGVKQAHQERRQMRRARKSQRRHSAGVAA